MSVKEDLTRRRPAATAAPTDGATEKEKTQPKPADEAEVRPVFEARARERGYRRSRAGAPPLRRIRKPGVHRADAAAAQTQGQEASADDAAQAAHSCRWDRRGRHLRRQGEYTVRRDFHPSPLATGQLTREQTIRRVFVPVGHAPVLPTRPPKQSGTRFGPLDTSTLPASSGGGGRLRLEADVQKREEVREAFAWSWAAYEKHAWGSDEVNSAQSTARAGSRDRQGDEEERL